ncbi:NAD-dependent epimerase/dehydratase family protein [Bordetella bronchiseptica]|uniref:NAD-dependent epimerase/dehydratase family protein n=1 Tax=Bordetella bronchiseptica TaxID=518 RepID=UPI00028ADC4A|nr:NAD-dependent epimerase/dehydratase family protein [Bordetella bronchiseptica]KDD58731.1 NAD dependent epimerase/dehydratase family protein [Bordetella bronchiseptica OSU553]AWQ03314.1 nucleotide sugar epimerase [Bordetella bronchiseptica]KAK51574.1 NAD dependent epimerase/dehydratase family protein [Bordetella bronchiseptica OSU054]KDB78768.1 NAD dependent epimerase/dehydratase family protein [Bordetella bronchiseptica CA90 BB1334]KDD43542.1 NAD dependent epimerase/dehydratase family prote
MSISNFSGTRVLVVGGAGFVGSNLVHQILAQDPREIIVVDNLLSSDVANVPADSRVTFVFGSITEDKILAALPDDLDFAFHLACYHGNQSSIANPIADHDNNTLTSLKLFDRLREIKSLKKVVYAAAACAVAEKTYDQPSATTEDQPVTLYHDSPYSISKIIGELYGNYYFQRFGLPFVKARFSNVYGPREILGAGQWRGTVHTVWRNVTPTFIWRALNGESLPLDNGGNASRDFIFVEDMARGLIACALKGEAGEVYNLATGRETTILDLATLINEFADNAAPLDLRPARDWDRSGKRFASTEKAAEVLGFTAQIDIREGIRRTVLWTTENRDLIERNINKHAKQMSQAGA